MLMSFQVRVKAILSVYRYHYILILSLYHICIYTSVNVLQASVVKAKLTVTDITKHFGTL